MRCRIDVFLAAFLAVIALDTEACASGIRAGITGELRLSIGLATVAYDESDAPVAEFEAAACNYALRLGAFLGRHVVLGAEVAATWSRMTSTLRVRDARSFGAAPSHVSYGYIAPLGAFIELYPGARSGVFFGAAGGVGMMKLPPLSLEAGSGTMARYVFELGYDPSRSSGEPGWGAYVQLEHWRGADGGLARQPDGLVSSQLLLGFRWTLSSREH
jgi:hypothetical protein